MEFPNILEMFLMYPFKWKVILLYSLDWALVDVIGGWNRGAVLLYSIGTYSAL